MITEDGIVTQVGPSLTKVKTIRKAACEGCASSGSCEGSREGEVEAVNNVGAKKGDSVLVGFESGSFLKISMLLYLFPVICMIAGAIMGSQLAPQYQMDESNLSALLAFSAFFISIIVIRLISRRMAGDSKYQAKILRIKGRGVQKKMKPSCQTD